MAIQEFTTEELKTEEWRDVAGYEGFYSVSSLGRVRRELTVGGTKAGRILRPRGYDLANKWYPNVSLSKHGIVSTYSVHVLVAYAFLGPPLVGHWVNHKDGIKRNCRIENLEYRTPSGNTQHAFDSGLIPKGENHYSRTEPHRLARGERHGSKTKPDRVPRGERSGPHLHPELMERGENRHNAKMTDEKVRDLLRHFQLYRGAYQEWANKFNVDPTLIKRILLRQTWTHVQVDTPCAFISSGAGLIPRRS